MSRLRAHKSLIDNETEQRERRKKRKSQCPWRSTQSQTLMRCKIQNELKGNKVWTREKALEKVFQTEGQGTPRPRKFALAWESVTL